MHQTYKINTKNQKGKTNPKARVIFLTKTNQTTKNKIKK